ncbi:MAG: hypothetical protein RMX97_02660 [Nostoc sp. DedQUE11]|nr:hypothetical protein [Nostoc sp. DedQUE11]
MALPEGHDSWEHLQRAVTQTHNKVVRDYFNDLGGDDWEPEITTPRGSLRTACTVLDTDTAPMTLIRMLLFNHTLGYKDTDGSQEDSNELTTVNRGDKPAITIYFLEPQDEVEQGYRRIEGKIKFRIMPGISAVNTETELRTLGTRIRNEFAKPTRFIWKKGKTLISYCDWDKGYQFQLLVREKSDAKQIISKVLSIQNHVPDWKYMNVSENEEPTQAYPTIPGTTILLGETKKEARRRPVANVRYRYSTIKIPGLPEKIVLHDSTGLKSKALIKD